jgi:hypothetical protein
LEDERLVKTFNAFLEESKNLSETKLSIEQGSSVAKSIHGKQLQDFLVIHSGSTSRSPSSSQEFAKVKCTVATQTPAIVDQFESYTKHDNTHAILQTNENISNQFEDLEKTSYLENTQNRRNRVDVDDDVVCETSETFIDSYQGEIKRKRLYYERSLLESYLNKSPIVSNPHTTNASFQLPVQKIQNSNSTYSFDSQYGIFVRLVFFCQIG